MGNSQSIVPRRSGSVQSRIPPTVSRVHARMQSQCENTRSARERDRERPAERNAGTAERGARVV